MKLKISIVFLLLAGVFVFFVFKGGYFNFESQNTPEISHAEQKYTLDTKSLLNALGGMSLSDFQGKKLVVDVKNIEAADILAVHFWASWCAPCISEVPELIAYSKAHKEVKFVLVSMDYDLRDIAKFMKSFPDFDSPKYIRIWDENKTVSSLFLVDRLPMTVVFKKDAKEPQIFKTVVPWKSIQL